MNQLGILISNELSQLKYHGEHLAPLLFEYTRIPRGGSAATSTNTNYKTHGASRPIRLRRYNARVFRRFKTLSFNSFVVSPVRSREYRESISGFHLRRFFAESRLVLRWQPRNRNGHCQCQSRSPFHCAAGSPRLSFCRQVALPFTFFVQCLR